MGKIKLTLTVAFLSILTFMTGCSEEKIQTDFSDEVTVSLRLDEALQEKAYVRLLHDGSRDDYWYYMFTQDLETEAALLLKAQIDAVIAVDGELVGNVGVNKSIMLTGLDPKTDYRVIASRISDTGELLGNVAELCFVTKRDPAVFEDVSKDVWEISYKTRKVDGNEETEVFTCDVKDEEFGETYIPCLLAEEDFKKGYDSDIRACFEDYVAYLNLENVKWSSKVTDVDSEFTQDRLRSGKYILFMIGVDAEGALTGYYSRTDLSLAQETPTDAYSKWIGKWLLTGMYLNDHIEYEVEISPEENNLYYRLYGWESSTASDTYAVVPEMLPIKLYFEKTTGYAYVVSEELPDIPGNQALADLYNFYLYGAIDYDGRVVSVDVPNMRIARLRLTGTDNAIAEREIFKYDLNGEMIETSFLYFNYIVTNLMTGHSSYEPVTVDSKVPSIDSIRLERL